MSTDKACADKAGAESTASDQSAEYAEITSKPGLEAALEALVAATRSLKALTDQAAGDVARIGARLAQTREPHDQRIAAIERAIEDYVRANRGAVLKGTALSAKFYGGTVGFRLSKPSVELVGDEEDIIERLREAKLGKLIATSITVNKAEILKDPAKAAGISGVVVHPAAETFFIKPVEFA